MAISLTNYLYLLPFLLLLPSSTTAQPYRNISLASSLTADDSNLFWPSPSGDFAFGFQRLESGGFLLSIWFNKIAERTIVWSANGANPAPRGSRVLFTTAGQLVLNDPQGGQIWSSNFPGTGVSYAAMLDTGNFVLVGEDLSYLWQSFDEPTDTLLPSQTMGLAGIVIARYSESNYSNGRFHFSLQPDGNLVFYTRNFPMGSNNFAYTASNTLGSGFQVIFNLSGSIYLTARNGSVLYTLTSNTPSTRDFYQRAILEYDGVFRQYVYPKTDSSTNNAWSALSNPVPSNICLRIGEETGSGACGFNSYCSIGNDQRPICQCPRSYTFIDPDDRMKGCKPSFVSQSCDQSSPETDLFHFYDMLNTDWPGSDYEHFNQVAEDWCRNACLEDCFCAVAISRNGECWKKRVPLSNGRIDPSVGGKALVKIRRDNSTVAPADSNKNDHKTLIIIGSALLSSSVLLNIVLLLATLLVVFKFKKRTQILQAYPAVAGMNMRIFGYKELNKATNGFKEQLGSGAFATVYKGVIESDEENSLVAVKVLDKLVKEGDNEFKAEVSAIGRTNHKNLVKLLGYCSEGQSRLLVYEFMKNGSLANYLFGSSTPNWYQRLQIALGTARGLCYLHEECGTQIIHCDIKPQNVLLDDSFTSKISDFGLAKLLKTDQTRTTTAIRGTKGYVAPEWFRNMPITAKVDVYSYGILLLEIICCRKNFEPLMENENEMVLADWAYDCYKERNLEALVENDDGAMNDLRRVEKYVMIAMWCIQEDPSLRPTMKKIIQMLEGAVEVSVPPDPSSLISSISI